MPVKDGFHCFVMRNVPCRRRCWEAELRRISEDVNKALPTELALNHLGYLLPLDPNNPIIELYTYKMLCDILLTNDDFRSYKKELKNANNLFEYFDRNFENVIRDSEYIKIYQKLQIKHDKPQLLEETDDRLIWLIRQQTKEGTRYSVQAYIYLKRTVVVIQVIANNITLDRFSELLKKANSYLVEFQKLNR